MRFRVLRDFRWDGKSYSRGDTIEIAEGHPRIDIMSRERFVAYDATTTPPTPLSDSEKITAALKKQQA